MALGNLGEKMEIAKRKTVAITIRNLMIDAGQKDKKFKLGEEIRYSPCEVYDIIMKNGVGFNITP